MLHTLMRVTLYCMIAISGAAAETVVIEADSYLDVVAGRIASPAVIVVDGDKISAINPATPQAGAKRIVLPGHTLLPGFTTVRDHGTGLGFSDIALMNAIDKGWVIGPRVIPAGHALSISGGHCDPSMGFAPGIEPPNYVSGRADGVDEVVKAVRHQIKHGAKVIKICATVGVLSFKGPVGAQQRRRRTAIASRSPPTHTAPRASSPRARPASTASTTTRS